MKIKIDKAYEVVNLGFGLADNKAAIIELLKLNGCSRYISDVLEFRALDITNLVGKKVTPIKELTKTGSWSGGAVLVSTYDNKLCRYLYAVIDKNSLKPFTPIASKKLVLPSVGQHVYVIKDATIDVVVGAGIDGAELSHYENVPYDGLVILPDIRERKYKAGEEVSTYSEAVLDKLYRKCVNGDYVTKFMVTSDMISRNIIGKQTSVMCDSDSWGAIKLCIDDGRFSYSADVITPLITNDIVEKATIVIKDKSVTVTLADGRVGVSKCADKDNFDFSTGINIAVIRAVYAEIK